MSLDNKNIHGADDMIRRLKEAKEYIREDVPEVIGTEAVKHFKKGFADEGFTDKSLEKWATRTSKVKLKDKKILTGQGSGDHLSDSIEYKTDGTTVTIYSDKLYAQVHNEGFDGEQNVKEHTRKKATVKAFSRKMKIPKRQFMGESAVLIETITAKITRDLTRILND